ncbi:hypothetical protein CU098_004891 [Rhizopus stolonifer]|uniref:Xylanolytic transcriptional activator regulatory domain-containing protein n=1 Tax=Rhizopus stolonifer TaxID=4846 RepID=A0A367KKR4_RHIST|nr:hypothetical protein CU098_004891 [Rhizopus stolonifer]
MITQEPFLPLSFSKKENGFNSVLIDQFLKDALQILKHADETFCDQLSNDDIPHDTNESVTWQLNLTPTMMTLNTSILTISGLEKVLELIRINVNPPPPRFQRRKLNPAHSFDMDLFRAIIYPVLQLSQITTIPRSDPLQLYSAMQMLRYCVQNFIECGFGFFLDIPSVLANTEMIVSQPDAVKEHRVEALLILSISALMIRHGTIHRRGDMTAASALMHHYHTQARQLLEELFDVHHVSVVQSMFLLSLFPQGHMHLFSPQRIPSPLLTMAIRMAFAMDLHQLDTQHDKESDQKEKLRRLAWMLLCADYYAEHNTSGKTGLIDVTNWHVDFPQTLPGEQRPRRIEFFSQYCRIIMIRKLDLFKSIHLISIKSPKALAVGLDQKLFQTYLNTPDTFQLTWHEPNPSWSSKSDIESLLLHELYCHTHIVSLLPFLPKRYFESFMAEQEGFRYANLEDIYQRIIRLNDSTPSPSPSPFIRSHPTQITFITEYNPSLEFYCIVHCLETLNKYTLILEALTAQDAIGCHHSPVYGVTLTLHLYLLIEQSTSNPDIRTVCRINLIRTRRILRHARSVYADPAILFLERVLIQHQIQTNEEASASLRKKSFDLVHSLKAQSSVLYQDNEEESEDEEDDEYFVKRLKQE